MNETLRNFLEASKGLLQTSWEFLKRFLVSISHLAEDTDVEGTISGVKAGVVLSGSNLWILICSTIIACIGLDTNSAAVIIGAMLISPLMSPILGVGLSLGINDRVYLGKSLLNFMGAIFLSLVVAVIYFKLTPYGTATDEMIARTKPTLLDAFVALFGGLAGIIAGSRTQKTNAIPGVAIATALMPPLCTSGYGLATGDFRFFGGAFYLFFINAVLISMSTYIIVRLLKFPKMNEQTGTFVNKGTMTIFLVLLLAPSVYFLFQNVQELSERYSINRMAESSFGDIEDLKSDHLNDTLIIRLSYYGKEFEEDSIVAIENHFVEGLNAEWVFWISSLINLSEINHCTIDANPTKASVTKKDYEQTSNSVQGNSKEISLLRSEVEYLKETHDKLTTRYESFVDSVLTDTIPFSAVKSEIKALFPELGQLSVGKPKTTSFADSIPDRGVYLAALHWTHPKNSRGRINTYPKEQERIRAYLTVKLRADTVYVVNY